MESSGECCVISSHLSEREEAPQVTLLQQPGSPLPSSERKREETPTFDGSSGARDNVAQRQGRLLSLTPTSDTSATIESIDCELGKPEANGDAQVGLKKWFNNCDSSKKDGDTSLSKSPSPQAAAVASNATSTTTPPQISPKLAKTKLTKEEREKLKAEKERQRVEKEKEKAEAKAKREEEKEKKKLEKQRKEEEKKERQRKREQEMKERQEKREREELEKKERREKREAEKQRKEDEKKRKEEEKRQVEMEKEQAKEEKLRKEQQAQKRILSFFNKLPQKDTVQNKTAMDSEFFELTPFPTKPDVYLAPLPRSPLEDSAQFDEALSRQNGDLGKAYLEECKHMPKISGIVKERVTERETCDKNNECMDMEVDDDVIITSPATSETHPRPSNVRYKLLQFHTNHRPAYFGTWRKESKLVNPRNPFKKDMDLLDYEVDSDDEWEEEEPGESLSDSEGEDTVAVDSGDDDEEEDGFFVPHGYLSDSEGDHSGDEGSHGQDDQDLKQQKQVSKAKAWEAEFARKCQPLKPIKIGCVWTSGDQEGGVANVTKEMEFLQQFEAVPLVELPIAVETKGETTAEAVSGTESSKLRAVPEEAMPDLIRLVHKNSMGLGRLIKTFRTHWGSKVMNFNLTGDDPIGTRERSTSPSDDLTKATVSVEVSPFCKPKTPCGTNNNSSELENASGISKRQLEKKIQFMATKEVRPPSSRQLWYVHNTVLEKYNIDVNTLSPLLTSPSVGAAKSTPSENGNSRRVPSPQTPYGSGTTRKRKPKGVKSLFDFVNSSSSSPSSGTATSGGRTGVVKSPSVKQTTNAIMEVVSNSGVKTSKPLATLVSLLANHAQAVSPGSAGCLEPPLKKPRLDASLSSKSPTAENVIINRSDNDKENDTGGALFAMETAQPVQESLCTNTTTTTTTVSAPPGDDSNTTTAVLTKPLQE